MDDKWQMETDARLNAIQSKLESTRKIAVTLAVLVVALGAWVAYSSASKPKKIVLEDRGSSLTLEPSQVTLKVGGTRSSLAVDGLWVRDEGAGKNGKVANKYTNISAGMITTATQDGAMVSMTALEDNADLLMVTHHAGTAELKATGGSSELRVAYGSKGVNAEVTSEEAKITGIGKAFFGLGDTDLAGYAPPPPMPTPPPAPAPKH